ncbi:hypothetical protein ACHAQA_006916 [Verticillium albo-atrum]
MKLNNIVLLVTGVLAHTAAGLAIPRREPPSSNIPVLAALKSSKLLQDTVLPKIGSNIDIAKVNTMEDLVEQLSEAELERLASVFTEDDLARFATQGFEAADLAKLASLPPATAQGVKARSLFEEADDELEDHHSRRPSAQADAAMDDVLIFTPPPDVAAPQDVQKLADNAAKGCLEQAQVAKRSLTAPGLGGNMSEEDQDNHNAMNVPEPPKPVTLESEVAKDKPKEPEAKAIPNEDSDKPKAMNSPEPLKPGTPEFEAAKARIKAEAEKAEAEKAKAKAEKAKAKKEARIKEDQDNRNAMNVPESLKSGTPEYDAAKAKAKEAEAIATANENRDNRNAMNVPEPLKPGDPEYEAAKAKAKAEKAKDKAEEDPGNRKALNVPDPIKPGTPEYEAWKERKKEAEAKAIANEDPDNRKAMNVPPPLKPGDPAYEAAKIKAEIEKERSKTEEGDSREVMNNSDPELFKRPPPDENVIYTHEDLQMDEWRALNQAIPHGYVPLTKPIPKQKQPKNVAEVLKSLGLGGGGDEDEDKDEADNRYIGVTIIDAKTDETNPTVYKTVAG